MKWLIWMLLGLFAFISVCAVTESDIPRLTNFHQFYGRISGLPAGSFTLRLQAGTGAIVTAAIASDGKYGYAEAVKVTGTAGDTVTFTVVNSVTNAPQRVGDEPYVNGGVREKNWQYAGPGGPQLQGPGDALNGTTTSENDTQESSSRRPRTRSRNVTTSPQPTGACLYSWDCGTWTICSGGSQTRTCIRSDTCDTQLARKEVSRITAIPKPIEQQSCSSSAVAVICPRNSKRCLGNNLQQCSSDGSSWTTINSCPNGCNQITFTCNSESGEVPSPLPIPWIPISAGAAGLILVAAVIFLVLHFRHSGSKLQPVREYIAEAKKKGFSDAVIQTKLVAQGWDAEQINKILMKK